VQNKELFDIANIRYVIGIKKQLSDK
jgi:hypothetical protein